MNNHQLYNAALSDQAIRDYGFLGVFSLDTLPVTAITSYPYTLIVNTANKNSAGEHWVAIHKDICQNGWFFDSYGIPPKLDQFLAVMDSCQYWNYNNTPLQSHSTTTCGQYCLFFIYHSARGYNLEEIAHLLNQDSDRIVNDAIVNSFVNDTFDIAQVPLIDFPFVFSQVSKMANLH